MPFITMKNTTNHEMNKHRTIHHFNPPGSSIDGAISKVVRYQKYVVADLHSGKGVELLNVGHVAHGNSN